ncbi:hypothetical protein M3J07_013557 [Ascochyta lentis]
MGPPTAVFRQQVTKDERSMISLCFHKCRVLPTTLRITCNPREFGPKKGKMEGVRSLSFIW